LEIGDALLKCSPNRILLCTTNSRICTVHMHRIAATPENRVGAANESTAPSVQNGYECTPLCLEAAWAQNADHYPD
jgi:hypothetical protein